MPQEDLKNRVLESHNKLIWSVKDQREVSGPLGGVSVEYILEVNTSRYEFKTSFQSESAVVNFTISKTFREVEYLYNKLKSQFSAVSFPEFFKKDKKQSIESVEERCVVINKVLGFISEQSSLLTSPILLDFIDFRPNKQAANSKPVSNRQPNIKSSSNVEDGKALQKATHNAQPENIFGVDVGGDDDDDDDDLFKKIKPHNTSERVTSSKASSSLVYSDEHLLFERQDLGGALLKDEDDIFTPLNAKLGSDRLDKAEQALEDATELLRVDDSLSDILEEIQKKPSKPPVKSKPIIKPKPVLNVSKDKPPALSPRPHTLVSTRPVPPPRATLSSKGAASPTLSPSSSDSPSKSIGSDVTPATDEIDILDYINKEVNAMKENLDLF